MKTHTLTLFIVLATVTQVASGETARYPVLDQKANPVFLVEGPMYLALPELVAQLEVPAGIYLGYISAVKEVEYPPHFAEPGRPPADEWSPEFEFKNGTVREALNAFVMANPRVSWSLRNGRIILRHSNARSTLISILMRRKLQEVKFEEESFLDAMRLIDEAIQRDLGDVAQQFKFAELAQDLDINRIFDLRIRINKSASMDLKATPLEICLDQFADALGGNVFWCAAEAAAESDVIFSGHYGAFVTNWSKGRHSRPLEVLIESLDISHTETHGYESPRTRKADAKCELRRRLRFDPEKTRKALLEDFQKVLKRDETRDIVFRAADDYMDWLFSLNDNELTATIIEWVHSVQNPKYKSSLMRGFGRPDHPQYKSHFHSQWLRLANSDDKDLAWVATYTLEWSKARDRYLIEKKLNP